MTTTLLISLIHYDYSVDLVNWLYPPLSSSWFSTNTVLIYLFNQKYIFDPVNSLQLSRSYIYFKYRVDQFNSCHLNFFRS